MNWFLIIWIVLFIGNFIMSLISQTTFSWILTGIVFCIMCAGIFLQISIGGVFK